MVKFKNIQIFVQLVGDVDVGVFEDDIGVNLLVVGVEVSELVI